MTNRNASRSLAAGIICGLAMAFVIGLMAKTNLDFAAPWTATHTLTAQVTDADGIAYGSDVRVAGRLVGQVTGVKAEGTYSNVTMHVNDSDWPLPNDTVASIRLATLLGQKYVQLSPGHSSTPLSDGAIIGPQQTKSVVDFDQILDTFNKPTRDSLTQVIRTASAAVKGQEGTLQELLPSLRDLSVHSQDPTGVLAARNQEINNILVNLGITADQLNQSSSDLAGVIDNLNSITGALASHQAALTGSITNMDQLNQTTNSILGNGGAQNLNAGFLQLGRFTSQLNTLVGQLVPETGSFISTGASDSARSLIFEIGDAISQDGSGGYFLRESTAGVDYCGLTPLCGPAPQPSSAPSLNLPALPQLTCQQAQSLGIAMQGCPAPSSGGTGGNSNGGLLPITISYYGSYDPVMSEYW